MARMIVTKDMTYATRRLKAGDELTDVSGPNSRLLAALGRARIIAPGEKIEEPKAQAEREAMSDLREDYERVFGKRPYMGWDADTLRAKIAAGPERD